ncbi:class I adenylate-forming enzyme family protein [Actinomycetospora sp. TBRC 11914]|uniref:class I adenylate-forming enzyme family protein n=1 Tax=Actinomycetospora sp. TBRC 11914 TaxID=2729387 RepID=UPI00145CE340|nr:class I adenylate-forming enzyme family protein [Actinomycetospora sp. TBRC 11914]NMO88246.1 acyl--CoA ligase [Actinomycetospora sp. TBRC 11914]
MSGSPDDRRRESTTLPRERGAGEAARAANRPYIAALLEMLHDAGERTVLRHEGRDVSGSALLGAVHRYGRVLDQLGVGHGDLVALYAPNRPESLVVRYATHLLGAASVYLSAPPDPAIRARMLVDFDPRLVVVFPQTAHLLPQTSAPIVAVGPVNGVETRLDVLAADQASGPLHPRARQHDLAVVVSSGGTTGVPKGSVRDFATWTASVRAPHRPERRQLANGPLAYLTQILIDQTLLGAGTVVLDDDTTAAATLTAIEQERITDLFLVEPQLVDLVDHPDLAERDLRSLRTLTHIGASAPPTLRRRAYERLGPRLAHTYGASEMGIVSAASPAAYDRDGFTGAGPIVPGVEVRFRRTDTSLDPTVGRVEVRSPTVAQGYRHRPVDAAANFVDGWYRTGDLGRLDDAGCLHVLGRAVDCEDLDGALVSPTSLEDTLCRLPPVRYAVAVCDLDRPRRILATLGWPGRSVDPRACIDAIRVEHGASVADTVIVVPLTRMPLTEQGKPDRSTIRRLAAARAAPRGREA